MFTPLRTMLGTVEGRILAVTATATLAVGTVAYSALEGWSLVDSLYFSVVTLATVGFGDLTPTTDVAKLFTVGYILIGLGILAAFVSELTKTRQSIYTGGRIERVEKAVGRAEHEVVAEVRHHHDDARPDGTPAP